MFSLDKAGKLIQWDLRNHLVKTTFFEECHSLGVRNFTICDGYVFTTGNNDYDIKQWSMEDGVLVKHHEKAHDDIILNMITTPNGKFLWTGCASSNLKEWDVTQKILHKKYGKVHTGHISEMTIWG